MPFANTLYVPARKVVTAITNANPAIVTTSIAHDYVSGVIVRMNIPESTSLEDYGMPQINQQFAPIQVIDSTNFYIDIDTRLYEPLHIPMNQQQYPQCIAIGELNDHLDGAVHNSLNPQDILGV